MLPLFATGVLLSAASSSGQTGEVYWTGDGDGVSYEANANWHELQAPDAGTEAVFGETGHASSGEIGITGFWNAEALRFRSGSFTLSGTQSNYGLNIGAGGIGLSNSTVTLGSATSGGRFRTGGMTVDNSTLTLQGDLEISGLIGSTNALVLADALGSTATFHHRSGNLTIANTARFLFAGQGSGSYHLHSGATLNIGGISLGGAQTAFGNYEFNLEGGKIVVTDTHLVTSVDSTIASGRTVIDTNGLEAHWSGNITSSAAPAAQELAKEGDGELIFSGATRQMHAFATLHGTTRQTNGDTSSNGFLVGYGAGNTSTYEMDGGTLSIYSIEREGQSPLVGTLRIGDYGGTGAFNHNAGDVILEEGSSLNIGNLSGVLEGERIAGDGTYNLNDGTLTLKAGLHNIGRSQGVHTAHGTLNMIGGMLIAEGGQLIIGSRHAATVAGTGVFHQTGGIADFTTGRLLIGSHGHGVYNLYGGELRIGGSNQFAARYDNSSGTYAFNFGNGRLTVSGSNLVTSVSATLVSGTTATVNTNGFSGTFNSSLSGEGNLRKEGAGLLSVQTVNAGKVEVAEGEMTVTSLTADEVDLAAETTLRTGSHTVTSFRSAGAALGSSSSDPFQIASGSRLDGTATLLSATEISGTVRAGSEDEAGVITAQQRLTAHSGSRFEMGLFENSNSSGSYSQIVGEAGIAFEGSVTVHLLFSDEVDFSDAFWQSFGQEWLLFAGQIESVGDWLLSSNIDYSDYGRFELFVDSGDGVGLRWHAIPEPSAYALLALTAMGAALLRRPGRRV